MTLPNQTAGVTPGLLYALTGPGVSNGGTLLNALSQLAEQTQPNVTAALKANIQTTPQWVTDLFSGLEAGASLPLAIIGGIITKLFPGATGVFTSIEHALSLITPVAIVNDIENIASAITAGMGSIGNDVTAIEAAFAKTFSGIDLTSNTPIVDYVDTSILPVLEIVSGRIDGEIATLYNTIISAMSGSGANIVDVLNALKNIPGLNIVSQVLASIIPYLDASKILTGTFDMSKVAGLITAFTGIDLTSGTPIIDYVDGVVAFLADYTHGQLESRIAELYSTIISAFSGSGGNIVDVLNAMKNIPGLNIISQILATCVPFIDASKILTGVLPNAISGVDTAFNAIVAAIHGGTPTAQTAANAQAALTALNGQVQALIGGGTLTQYTASGTWTKPTTGADGNPFVATDLFTVVCINGGDGGKAAQGTSPAYAGQGGQSGGYVSKQIAYSSLPATVAMTIGAAGAAAGGAGGVTSFGSLVIGTKGLGAAYKADGTYSVSIPPGDGGRGVCASSVSIAVNGFGSNGNSGPFASGGAVAAGSTAGQAGSAAPSGIPSGGGGGGGGGIVAGAVAGAGGFPGGGGGGGGAYGAGNTLASAAGAAGCIYVTAPH